jgi:hypothetical protein
MTDGVKQFHRKNLVKLAKQHAEWAKEDVKEA